MEATWKMMRDAVETVVREVIREHEDAQPKTSAFAQFMEKIGPSVFVQQVASMVPKLASLLGVNPAKDEVERLRPLFETLGKRLDRIEAAMATAGLLAEDEVPLAVDGQPLPPPPAEASDEVASARERAARQGEAGKAQLEALERAKALLGPEAIATRIDRMGSVRYIVARTNLQDEPAYFVGLTWDDAFAQVPEFLEKERAASKEASERIAPDDDLSFEGALAFAKHLWGHGAIVTFSPADQGSARVFLATGGVGTPNRKWANAASFLQAFGKIIGLHPSAVRGEYARWAKENGKSESTADGITVPAENDEEPSSL